MGANDPSVMASLDPRSMVGRIYVGDYRPLLHTKYISCRPHGFREEDISSFAFFVCLFVFFLYKSVGANDLRDITSLDPRGLIGRINAGKHQNIATY